MSSPAALCRQVAALLKRHGFVVERIEGRVGHNCAHVRHADGRLQKIVFANTPRVPEDSARKTLRSAQKFASAK